MHIRHYSTHKIWILIYKTLFCGRNPDVCSIPMYSKCLPSKLLLYYYENISVKADALDGLAETKMLLVFYYIKLCR